MALFDIFKYDSYRNLIISLAAVLIGRAVTKFIPSAGLIISGLGGGYYFVTALIEVKFNVGINFAYPVEAITTLLYLIGFIGAALFLLVTYFLPNASEE